MTVADTEQRTRFRTPFRRRNDPAAATAAKRSTRQPKPAKVTDPAAAAGSMTLVEHLRELRNRVFWSVLAILAAAVVGWIYYQPIFDWITAPFTQVIDDAKARGQTVELILTGIADPFTLKVQIALVSGVLIAAPIWLYQLWRFITPGLHRHERRWAVGFVVAATPFFVGGMALAYLTMPHAYAFFLDFTPTGVSNLLDVSTYLNFFIRTELAFGVAFLAPLVAVVLNLASILPGRKMVQWWRAIVVGIVGFAAVATPTTDPGPMALLVLPMLAFTALATGIMLLNDRRRARRRRPQDEWSDDEASPLDLPEH
ncbi:MAG: twin-arginine translocase subunit TatC [Actinomycetota bacterium]|nr:MAG: twin-arginine translocase subunit TatC [Actinomycetota bacterium]